MSGNLDEHVSGTTLAAQIIDIATRDGYTIATAESCTGGLVGHLLTEIPGASKVFLGGWIPYDNRRKTEDLSVHPDILRRVGAVSQQVAETLAQGARKKAGATFAVATTGIAGPTSVGSDKTVGTLWVAVAGPDGVEAFHHTLNAGDRHATKNAFAQAALQALWDALVASGTD